MTTGEKVKRLRQQKGFSQEHLAEASGLSLRTIQRIEKGHSSPRPYTLKTLSDALEVQTDQLLPASLEEKEPFNNAIHQIRLVNLAALGFLLFPGLHVLLALMVWKKNNQHSFADLIGRKIISLQIIWTLGTLLLVFLTPIISRLLLGASSVGQFPTVQIVYLICVLINLFFIIRTYQSLSKDHKQILSGFPRLI